MTRTKNYFKIFLCFIAFAVLSVLFALGPVLTSYAALDYSISAYNVAINSIKIPNKKVDVSKGDELKIPLLDTALFGTGAAWDSATYKVRVIDPAGAKYDYTVGGANDAAYFDSSESGYIKVKALNNGQYDIVYILTVGGKTYYSNTYTVSVENVSYNLNLTDIDGLNYLIPTRMKTSNVGDAAFVLPEANATLKDDTFVEKVAPKVTKNGASQVLNAEGSCFKEDAGIYSFTPSESGTYVIEYTYSKGSNPPTKTYTVTVTDDFVAPASTDLTITTPTMPSVELGAKNVTLPKLTVSDKYNNNVAYNITSIVITKSSNSSITKTLTNNTMTFDMTKDFFNAPSYSDLVGNYEIKYTIVDAYNNTKTVTYVIKDVTDNTKPNVYMAYSYELDVHGNPVQKEVENDDGDMVWVDDVNTNYAANLKYNYGYAEIVLPAIYATDNVSGYSDFSFIRYIQNTNTKTIYYVDNIKYEDGEIVTLSAGDEGYNYSGDLNIGKFNQAVKFQFTQNIGDSTDNKGEYQIGYYVVSNTVKKQENYVYSSGTTRYIVNVLGNATNTETSTPTIEISSLKNNATLSSDDTTTVYFSSNDDIDARLKHAMFYYYSTNSANTFKDDLLSVIDSILNNTSSDTYKYKCNVLDDPLLIQAMKDLGYVGFGMSEINADNKYAFDLTFENYASQTSAIVAVVAINDNGNIAVDSKTVTLKDTSEEDAPTYTILTDNLGSLIYDSGPEYKVYIDKEFDQVATVILPTIQFNDADSSLELSVIYYVNAPDQTDTGIQYKSPTGKSMKNNTIVGGQVITSEIGTYYVVYTATDDAGNTTVVFFTFNVLDSSDPILSVNATATGTNVTKTGSHISGNVGTIVAFDPSVYSSDGKTNLTENMLTVIDFDIDDDGQGLDFRATGDDMAFIFNDVGEYKITFTASYDGKSAIEKVIYVSISMPDLAWDGTIDVPEYALLNSDVYLPDWTATQGDIKATITVKVTDPDGLTPSTGDAERVISDGVALWKFTTNASVKGTYKVTYTAKTAYSTITKTFEIKVGDNVAPTFHMNHVDDLSQDIVYDGENQIEYIFELSKTSRTLKITVKSAGNTVYSYDTGLVIKDKDDSGTQTTLTSWSNLTVSLKSDDNIVTSGDDDGVYYISGVGECTLVLTMSDRYNNTSTKEISFDVVTEGEKSGITDEVIGAVLIVVSLVILGGVILFFTLTGKKGGSSKSKKTTKTIEDKKDIKAKQIKKESSDVKTGEIE